MKFSSRHLAAILAAPAFALCMTARADVFVKEVSISSHLNSSLQLPVGTNTFSLGLQDIKVSATASDADATSFLAYCVDPTHFSSTAYIDNFTPSAAHSVATLFASRAADIQNLYDAYYAGTVGNNVNAAAFQLALWEIANDDKVLTTGGVQKTATTLSQLLATSGPNYNTGSAQFLLDNYSSYAGPHIYDLTLYQVNRSVSPNSGQDYIVATVPEPTTYSLLFAGVGFIAFAARKASRKPA